MDAETLWIVGLCAVIVCLWRGDVCCVYVYRGSCNRSTGKEGKRRLIRNRFQDSAEMAADQSKYIRLDWLHRLFEKV